MRRGENLLRGIALSYKRPPLEARAANRVRRRSGAAIRVHRDGVGGVRCPLVFRNAAFEHRDGGTESVGWKSQP